LHESTAVRPGWGEEGGEHINPGGMEAKHEKVNKKNKKARKSKGKGGGFSWAAREPIVKRWQNADTMPGRKAGTRRRINRKDKEGMPQPEKYQVKPRKQGKGLKTHWGEEEPE